MATTALIDLERDVSQKFAAEEVSVVAIVVGTPPESVRANLDKANPSFMQLLDSDGKVFASVGTHALPRIYVLDEAQKVVWFDIEYSESTRRELKETLRVLTQDY